MRIAWITDPHFNHCSLLAWERLLARLDRCACDAVLISGDISEGDDVIFQLRRLADAIDLPIHFVLGNHDFYHSSIERTCEAVRRVVAEHPLLNYLTESPPLTIGEIGLVGVDGWGDATVGDYAGSTVRLNDFRLIDDFCSAEPSQWKSMLGRLGEQSARRLDALLRDAVQRHRRLLVVTHVPPFREACWYQGRTTDDNWAPFFVSGQCGQTLLRFAAQYPEVSIEVLCGHTHSEGQAQLAGNLRVTTAGAQYGRPDVAAVVEIVDGQLSMDLPHFPLRQQR